MEARQPTTTSKSDVEDGSEVTGLWPVLMRFYGLSPQDLRAIPRAVLRAWVREIPRIRAEEQLLALEASAYPHLKRVDAQRISRHYVREANSGRTAPAPSGGGSMDALAAAAIAAGIAVEFVEEGKDEPAVEGAV